MIVVTQEGKEFLGRGWHFPVQVEPDRGRIASVAHEDDTQQSIHIILSTSRGERVMRPDFGCGIHDLVFGVINSSLITQVKSSVKDALRKFEARIEVTAVDVDISKSRNGLMLISLDYRVRETNQSGNLVYPFYFEEAF